MTFKGKADPHVLSQVTNHQATLIDNSDILYHNMSQSLFLFCCFTVAVLFLIGVLKMLVSDPQYRQ